MASGPITSCQMEGEKAEAVTDFLFLCSKITADGDCGHKIRRQLLLGNIGSVLKSRDTFLTKLCVQSCSFSSSCVEMWELDHKEG